MIEKTYSGVDSDDFTVICDNCEEDHEYINMPTWSTLIESMKREGWDIKKEKEGWIHLCPDCDKEHFVKDS